MTNSPVYYNNVDQVIPVTVQFTNINGTGTIPAAVSIVVTDPNGTATTYTFASGVDPNNVVSDGGGAFHIWLTPFTGGSPPPAGLWTYVWMGTGGSVNKGFQIFTGTFRVLSYNDVGQAGKTLWYCSKEDLKSRLAIPQTDTADDYEIELAIATVTDWINSYTGRHFYRITEARTYRPDNVWNLKIDDIVTCTSLDLDYDGDGVYEVHWTENTNYQIFRYDYSYNSHDWGVERPRNYVQVTGQGISNPIGGGWFPWLVPFTRQDRVKITGVWGWPQIPANVVTAALLLAADLFKAKDAPWGVAGINDFGLVKVQNSPQVVELLRAYINVSKKVGV